MVVIKLVVLLFFVGVGALLRLADDHGAELACRSRPTAGRGPSPGAAIVFFAYIGFDAVSTVAEETQEPARDLPIGILASLAICTFIYMVVAAVFTGMIPYPELVKQLATEQAEPLTMALQLRGTRSATWAPAIVALGSVVAQTAVLLVFQLGQPRIFFSMARDGLLPPVFAKVHPRFQTPHVTTILTGVLVGGVRRRSPSIDEMVDLTNIGTLFAFILVCIGVTDPAPPRARPAAAVPRAASAWLLPMLGAGSCLFLMYYLPPASWWRFIGWLVLGLSIYTAYGYTRSTIGQALGPPVADPAAAEARLGRLPGRRRWGSSSSPTTPVSAPFSIRRRTSPSPSTAGRSSACL